MRQLFLKLFLEWSMDNHSKHSKNNLPDLHTKVRSTVHPSVHFLGKFYPIFTRSFLVTRTIHRFTQVLVLDFFFNLKKYFISRPGLDMLLVWGEKNFKNIIFWIIYLGVGSERGVCGVVGGGGTHNSKNR